ncbi:MAG: CDP-glucose 4,6-dehydratase [Betaproteobacteria bacterium]|nr:CDP-glucose 4,6-dehydratase [Betaproteobacteria bacterium]
MQVANTAFWRGKRVFVTGHTGFKGSWLTLWLKQLGAEVTGYALSPSTTPNLFDLARIAQEDCRSNVADIREYPKLREVLGAATPGIVFHLAAQPLVRRSYADPRETYETNVMGTVNLLEAIRHTPSVRAAVVVTSDKCYKNREWIWGYRENESMGGHDPYSNSKGCAELVTAAMRDSFFGPNANTRPPVAIASARAGNVIGGGDWAEDRLIPDIIRAIAAGRPANIRNPDAIRPWQHVLEPLAGYLQLAERLHEQGNDFASGWNFGPSDDETRTVRWICDHMVQRWGAGAAWQQDGGSHPHEAHYLKLDSSKARMQLGWRPRLTLTECLDWLVDWYRAHATGQDMRATTLQQINTYSQTST